MNPIPVPDEAKRGHPDCVLTRMGPPTGVANDDCGTLEMLIAPMTRAGVDLPGYGGRSQYAYFRPSPAELEMLAGGGYIEFNQLGVHVQPFSAVVWPAAPGPG